MASDKVELPASPAFKAQHKSAVLDVTDAETEAGSEPSMAELSVQAPQRWADAEEDPPAGRGSAPRWADADTDDDEDFWPAAAETAVADGWSVVGKKARRPRAPATQGARAAPPPSRRPQPAPTAQPRRAVPREAPRAAPGGRAAEEPRRAAGSAARGDGPQAAGRAAPRPGRSGGAGPGAGAASAPRRGSGAAGRADHRRGARPGAGMDPSRLQW